MTFELPAWAVWLQALGPAITGVATVTIAGVVARITFMQSRTARERLVLDLFKDRLAILTQVDHAIRLVMGPGRPSDDVPLRLLHEARGQARFLFGPEVEQHIKSLIKDVSELALAADMMEARRAGDDQGTQDWTRLRHDTMLRLSEASDTLAKLMDPYAKFTQRLPGR